MNVVLFGATCMVGQGLLQIAKRCAPRPILEARDIDALTPEDRS